MAQAKTCVERTSRVHAIKTLRALLLVLLLSFSATPYAAITYVGAGSGSGGKTTASPSWPTHTNDDVALLFVETDGGHAPSLTTAAGFVQITNSPQIAAAYTSSEGTQLSVYWARATSASMSAPTATVTKNQHIYAVIVVYRGVVTSGNPWDVTGGGNPKTRYEASSALGGPGTKGCIGSSSGSASCTLQTLAAHGFDGVDLNADTGFKWSNIDGGAGGESQVFMKVSSTIGTRSMGLYANNSSTGDTVTTASPRPGGEVTGPFLFDLNNNTTNTIEIRDNKGTNEHDAHYVEVETKVSSIRVPSVTTTVANTMIVQAASRASDSKSSAFTSHTNAALASLTERVDGGTKKGDGGGISIWDGTKATSGAIGTTTASVSDAYAAYITVALKPSATATVSYYRITHSGSGITCAAEPITIAAYDSTDTLVAPTAGKTITLSTSPATGTWATSNTYAFTGTETSATKYLRQTSSATLNINVTDGSNAESASYDPTITFVDSALKFYGTSALAVMPTQVAGVTDSNPILKAVRTDTSTGACVAQVTGSKTVGFGYECRNPTSCVSGQSMTLNGNGAQANANGASISYSSQTLTFNASGEASIPFNYTDVGQIRLHASLALAASGNDPAITLTGTSTDFVVKPYTLAVSSVTTSAGVANPGGSSAAGASAGFVEAGTAFKVFVEARNSAGNRTPNFGNETTPEHNNMKLAEVALVYPSGGTLTALSGAAANSFAATTPAGTFVDTTAAWNQVGSLTIRPELSDSSYLGAGDIFTFTTSGTIGRFYPDHYYLASASATNGCNTFSYMGQPNINLSYQLLARTAAGTTLTNYGGNYGVGALASPSYVAEEANGGDGATFSSRISAGLTPTWASGVLMLNSTVANVTREPTLGTPDGPYNNLQFGLVLTDTFDARSIQTKTMNALTTDNCSGGSCIATALGSPLVLRYGRARLSDAFGPETAALPVEFVTEYWTGSYFTLNTSDTCTVIPRAVITYPSGSLTTDGNRTVSLTGGATQGSYGNLDLTGVNFTSGSARHSFTKPTTGGKGTFTIDIDLTNLSWLRYDWNQDGNYSDTSIPTASYTFGSYRGHDRILYWRAE